MPNPYFRFKKFTVYHDRCAMKVGTDGVLLGAWVNVSGDNILDIGTGTGLISLMMAQRNEKAVIDAIDIDSDAVSQAKDNIENSPFGNRINSWNASLQEFSSKAEKRYDVIVSNPPFFVQSLKSPNKERSLARHTDSLPVADLIGLSASLLSQAGRISFIYPFDYKEELIKLAEQYKLSVSRITNVFPTPDSVPKRILIELSKEEVTPIENDLIIEKARHVYSDGFTALLKDFYLKM
ncbi:methyltransferase [Dysgonomonas mossii]|uniref:tRNA1(Val) (adenine(37)-N6)-methyltransferase n=1 Tax=Dysgonomonas mossii TaxID=163665 RepID=A0A4Y9IMR6_9BACT|nr:methyltransferase [Dysgonomonas mossii]MBF0760811.1 methyltransferase [Dysgonomonas mossii]TFU89773.1 methyltransferase domain-containing protein [Dysgonomonas mossii]